MAWITQANDCFNEDLNCGKKLIFPVTNQPETQPIFETVDSLKGCPLRSFGAQKRTDGREPRRFVEDGTNFAHRSLSTDEQGER